MFNSVINLVTGSLIAAVLAGPAIAQDTAPYTDFKVPPKPVSSDFNYEHKFIDILGSKMAYVDQCDGDPILFLHGQPTSSYLWRNIMPFMEGKGRIIAPDNIGFGKSDQPELDYTFLDHYRYFEAFVEELDLKNITLVVHDWGSGLGLHYAAKHPDNVKGIVTMEALLAPILPAAGYDAMPRELGDFFKFVRSPEGRKLIIEDNGWLTSEGFLAGFTDRPLAEDVLRTYQLPHQSEKARIQVNQWPNEIPIAGEPAATTEIIANYNAFLEETDIPWLFLYASPGATSPAAAADYWAERAKNIETVYIGHGLHYVQEDQPYAIGRAIADWYRRINK